MWPQYSGVARSLNSEHIPNFQEFLEISNSSKIVRGPTSQFTRVTPGLFLSPICSICRIVARSLNFYYIRKTYSQFLEAARGSHAYLCKLILYFQEILEISTISTVCIQYYEVVPISKSRIHMSTCLIFRVARYLITSVCIMYFQF